jgi:hypothetical protein
MVEKQRPALSNQGWPLFRLSCSAAPSYGPSSPARRLPIIHRLNGTDRPGLLCRHRSVGCLQRSEIFVSNRIKTQIRMSNCWGIDFTSIVAIFLSKEALLPPCRNRLIQANRQLDPTIERGRHHETEGKVLRYIPHLDGCLSHPALPFSRLRHLPDLLPYHALVVRLSVPGYALSSASRQHANF